MRLSQNSKDWVAKNVRDAFAEELKKANDAVEAEKARRNELFRDFSDEVDKVLTEAKKEVEKIVKRMKLTFRDDKRIDHLDVFEGDSCYSTIDINTFEETTFGSCKKTQELQDRVNEVEANIRTAVSKALFEIEMRGKKDTLETIVDQVIKEIKEGK